MLMQLRPGAPVPAAAAISPIASSVVTSVGAQRLHQVRLLADRAHRHIALIIWRFRGEPPDGS